MCSPHYLIIETILEKKILKIKHVFSFSLQLYFKTYLIRSRILRDIQIYTSLHVNSLHYYLDSYRQIFKKFANIKFYENPSILNRVVPHRRTDITEMIVGFRTITSAPKNWLLTARKVQLSIAGS
jgi:hypothetical protein